MAAFSYTKNGFKNKEDVIEFRKLLYNKRKLNLGSNIDLRNTYINVDILDFPELDLQCDIKDLHQVIPASSMDEILAYDILEHFPFSETKQLLADWICWLAPGGKIIVRTPDMERLSDSLLTNKLPLWEMQRLVYGGQEYEFNFHKAGFTSQYLEGLLIGLGCSQILQVVKESDTFNCTIVARK